MATIDFLMKDKAPGSVRLTLDGLYPYKWFVPFYKTYNGFWYGLDGRGFSDNFDGCCPAALYTESKPKKKVVMYQYLVNLGSSCYLTTHQSDYQSGTRIDSTRIEVEVDE